MTDTDLEQRYQRLAARHEALVASAAQARQAQAAAEHDEAKWKLVIEFFRVILAKRRHEGEVRTARLGTIAWREVFTDLDLELLVRPVAYRGQSGIELWYKTPQGEAKVKSGMGSGGAPHLLGFVLRLLTVMRHSHLARVLLLDEPMTQVSPKYHESLAAFMHRICHDLGFTMLVASHMDALCDAADRVYEIEVADEGSIIKRVR